MAQYEVLLLDIDGEAVDRYVTDCTDIAHAMRCMDAKPELAVIVRPFDAPGGASVIATAEP